VADNRESIVAIHGIGAHPDETWINKCEIGGAEARRVNWLEDQNMLRATVHNARIMRYGYESEWFGKQAIKTKVSSVAERLLISLRRYREVLNPCRQTF